MPLAKPFEVGNVAGRERKKMYVRPKRPGPGYQKIRCACGDVAGWAEGHRGRGNPEPRGICQACKDRAAAAATAVTTTET